MSSLKWILGLVVLLSLAFIAWWQGWVPLGAPSPAAEVSAPQELDSSDASIAADLATADADLKKLESDLAAIHTSLVDKEVAQVSVGGAAAIKAKAAEEIQRRLNALAAVGARVGEMNNVTTEFKSALLTAVSVQTSELNALKVKIDASSDVATLTQDSASLAVSHSVFSLVLPQIRISAAADRAAGLLDTLATLGAKLQARLAVAESAGYETQAEGAALGTLGTNLSAAQAAAQAAVEIAVALGPGDGGAAQKAANDAKLKEARDKIIEAQSALEAGLKSAQTIAGVLGSLALRASTQAAATTTVQTQ